MKLTELETNLMKKLGDGKRHRWYELKDDPLDSKNNVKVRIFHLRKKLEPIGQGVITEWYYGACYYRLVRFITTNDT